MDLNFNNKIEEYYQKFIELQDKLKRSEEQRFMLEIKFNEMTQVAKDEEQAHYKKLRTQYKKFLEEDQKRQDRNERIIRNLERIEARISMLSAKTERISMFRRQYQKYLQRIANSYPETKITKAKISKERSFIKEEPLKEQKNTIFRDDYSLPNRPKDTMIMDKDKLIYDHPAVKKSLEKDRSNEEKIEILDRYLQSISSQKCRDVLNQEKQAKEKLSLGTPIDKIFTDDFSSHSTNHATAVADDIMNSIYSRYYTKAEIAPKGNKVDLPKDMQNKNNGNSDYVKKEFKPDDKTYLNSLFGKTTDSSFEIKNPTVTFREGKNTLQHKDNKIDKLPEKTSDSDFPYNFKNTSNESYQVQGEYKNDILVENTDPKQETLNHAPENNKNSFDNYRNSMDDTNKTPTKDWKTDTVQNENLIINVGNKGAKNKNEYESINTERLLDNNLPDKDGLKNIETVNEDQKILLETENTIRFDSSTASNSNSQIIPGQDQKKRKENNPKIEDKLDKQSQEQFFKYQDQSQEQNQLQKLPFQYDPNNQRNPTEESYYPEQQSSDFNKQNKDKEYPQAVVENKDHSADLEIPQNNPSDQLAYNKNQSSIQYNQNGESVQPMEYSLKNQPYEQSQHDKNAQHNQYNPSDHPPLQYDENVPPAQFGGIEQPTELFENNPSYQQIQYDKTGQPIQYDETGQPIGYDQYGQPIMYDQNGQIVQAQYDENGQFIPQYDENGQMNMLYDHNGQLLYDDQYKSNQQYDLNEQPVQYDKNGQPIYDQNQQQYYDYTNQGQADPSNGYNQYQGDGQGQYIETQEGQFNTHIEDTKNLIQPDESQNYYQGNQGPYPDAKGNEQEGDNQYQAQLQTEEGNNYYQVGDQRPYPDAKGGEIEKDNQYQAQLHSEEGNNYYQVGDQGPYPGAKEGEIEKDNQYQAQLHSEEGNSYYQVGDQGPYPGAKEGEIEKDNQYQAQLHSEEGNNYYQVGDQGPYPAAKGGEIEKDNQHQVQLHTDEGNNYYQVGDQGPYPDAEGGKITGDNRYQANTEYHQSHENTGGMPEVINNHNGGSKKDDVQNNEITKPTNILDILDTDTESAKQNTSKISNESDFDFS